MSIDQHPRAQLSAYLDDALAPDERSVVAGHLASCADCRARLAELRSTASLIRALPDPIPSRRLFRRVAPPPVWLAPLRTLMTIASGASVFLFIASALLTNASGLPATAGRAAAPAVAPAASGAARAESAASAGSATTPSNREPASVADKAQATPTSTPVPSGAGFSVSATPPQDALARADQSSQRDALRSSPFVVSTPWLWLALAIVLGAIAIALQRRLRSL